MPEFACTTCDAKLRAPDQQAGRLVRCPKCKSTMPVPAPDVYEAEMAELQASGEEDNPQAKPVGPLGSSPAQVPALPDVQRAAAGRRYGFNCQYCSSRLEATTQMAGQEGHCPTCGNTIIIPILDRYGRLIDPMTGKVIKQDPHPVHAYAAAGERAPLIERGADGHQYIRCPRCKSTNPIGGNNCKNCGMPFTMEGTTLEAAGGSNGFATASLVLGIIGLVTFCTVVVPVLAVIFGLIALRQTSGDNASTGGRGLAIAGLVCGAVGSLLAAWVWLTQIL